MPTTPPTIACPSEVRTAIPFDCTITIVTPVDAPPGSAAMLRVNVPPGLFHLANSANARFDADSRQLLLPLALDRADRASRATQSISLSLIADDAGAGRTRVISASLEAATPVEAVKAAETVEALEPVEPVGKSQAVENPEAVESAKAPRESGRFDTSVSIAVRPGEPAIVGPLESPQQPLTATLLVVVLIAAALLLIRARRRSVRFARDGEAMPARSSSRSSIGAAAIGAIVSVMLLFFCMNACIETVRARTSFTATTCTIIDRGSAGLAPEIAYIPMAVVRYEAAGVTRLATGFDIRGTMYGSNDPDASRLFATGGRYPCWYDAAQPQRIILRQGPSFVAWFALLPLAILTLTLSALIRV